ncbi:MAG TPA: NAD(P)/FAD-dependent oxidoreductase [Patescibacteria group bacterium]|nr:NAD(P)/FAD-dependent oxidoreductase [Patescibacteria group bacterium]
MIQTDILVVGAGPAGLMAAIMAARSGCRVILLERACYLGGQLVKQTHKFFGSKAEHAGERGIDIARLLVNDMEQTKGVTTWKNATVLGYYPDGVLTVKREDQFIKVKPKKVIVATGASEKTLAFPNNDLPGIYGAGAVQTLMNVYGVVPGKRMLMVGAGNIGLIVAYQLLQSGVEVAGIVEAGPAVGGYCVHAAKVQRAGVPIYTSHTIQRAFGGDSLEGVTICKLDEQWKKIPGTDQDLAVDGLCLAVGLTPLTELLWQAGCQMVFVPELGGYVPRRTPYLQTTHPDIWVAGDVSGVEEASVAMVEGIIAGLTAAGQLTHLSPQLNKALLEADEQLKALRSGPITAKIRAGIQKALVPFAHQTRLEEVV